MHKINRLTLVLLLVATAAVASLITLAMVPSATLQAQGLVTRKVIDKPAVGGAGYAVSSYGFVLPPKSRRDEPEYTLGFFVLNEATGKTVNCQYMWAGLPINKCVEYGWVKLP